MRDSKLIFLIKSFSSDEMKDFYKYIISPYYNSEKSIMLLTSVIKKYYPGFEKLPAKEHIFINVYPGKKYNDSMMRNLVSKTMKLAESFVTQREFESNTNYKMLLKMRALSDRNQKFLFERSKAHAKEYLETYPYRYSPYYYTRMMFEDEVRRFALRQTSKVFLAEDNMQQVADNCILFFTTELLRTYAVMINKDKHNYEDNFDFRFLPKLTEYFEQNKEFFKDIHYAHLYYNSIKLFLTEEEKHFHKVHKITREHYNSLPDIDRKNAYVVLINYCAERVNKGDMTYIQKKFELYKEIIRNKAHYEGLPYISHVFYNRAAFNAINLGELAWAKNFIEEYKKELNEEHRENTYYLTLSEYYRKQGEHDNALEVLSKVKKADPLYKEEVYFLLLKIFYSAGLTESFYSEIESFREFLKTSKSISGRRKKLDINFIKLAKKLYDTKQKKELGQKYEIYSLKKEILENKYISDKMWLIERVNELEG